MMNYRFASFLWFLPLVALAPLEVAATTPVRTAEARAGAEQMEIALSGSVVASRRARVAAEVAGIVQRFEVRIGDSVRRGTVLARLRPAPFELRLSAAAAQLAESQARLRSSKLRLERLQELSASDVVSRQNVDDALYEMQAATARVDRLLAEHSLLEDQLERATMRAPFAGVVIEEHTQAGEWLEIGDPIIELVALEDVEIRLDVPEKHRRWVAAGSKARLRFESLGLREFTGEVRTLVPSAKDNARTFPAYIRLLENVELGIGSVVKATLLLGEERGAVWIPRDALVRREGRRLVFRLGEDSKVESVEIQESSDRGDWLAIRGGVTEGDQVITEGNENLEDGALVSARPREYAWP